MNWENLSNKMTRDERIKEKLQVLKPTHLVLKNISHQHAAHIQKMPDIVDTGETHYRLEISSADLQGKSRIDRQRIIHDLLREEFSDGMHALEIKVKD